MQKNIITDRLVLDLLTPEDHEFILNILNTSGWIRFIGDRKVRTEEDAAAYIQKILSTENLLYWVVRMKTDQRPAGIISFIKRTYLDHFDIGFAFLPEFNGKGYAHEAAKEVLHIAAGLPEHEYILATTIPENINSTRLLEKLGFHFDREIEVEQEKLHVYSSGLLT